MKERILAKNDCVQWKVKDVLLELDSVLPVPVFSLSAVIRWTFHVSVFSRDIVLKSWEIITLPTVISNFNKLIYILNKLKHSQES